MKRLLITSIAITLSIGGSLLFMSQNTNDIVVSETPVVVDVPIIKTESTVTTTKIETPIIETPIIEQPTIVEPAKVLSFDDLQLKYILLRKSSDLFAFIRLQQSIYPEKFTPDNIESSFEYINNYFDRSKVDYNFGILKNNFTWQ